MENIFRAYDIRGVYEKEISLEFAEQIGMSFGTFLGNEGLVVLGRDARHGGLELLDAVAAGLNRAGLDTIDIGMAPTPGVNFCILKFNATAGIIISASHNPPEYNGIRFRKSDGSGYPECIDDVKKMYFDKAWLEPKTPGNHRLEDNTALVGEYLDYIANMTDLKKPLKVVIDPGDGAASGLGKPLFEKLGCSVTTINDVPDGYYHVRIAYPNEKT